MLRGAPSQHFDVESTPPALTIIPMPTSNNNRTAERLLSRPLAPAERLPPRPLASLNDKYLSYPSVQNKNNNYYTPRVNSPHSHPPHHEGMRDQSLSLHPYSGRDSDSYGLMTPMSATNNKTTKSSSSLILSNHNNYSSISSPPSHHLHHQGYGGATSTFSSHSINNIEGCVESILALSPLPILSKVPGLSDNQVRDLRHILPLDYQPVCFASNNNAFHLALLTWRYDTILSQPGAAIKYLETHLHKRCMPGYTPTYWKAQTRHHSSDIDYIYKLTLKIDDQVERRQYAMSLLWHKVWLLQYSPSSTKPKLWMIIGISIAYWMRKMYKIHVGDKRFTTVISEVYHQHVMLCQLA